MRIENVRVHDLEESIVASGFPMLPYVADDVYDYEVENLKYWIDQGYFKNQETVNKEGYIVPWDITGKYDFEKALKHYKRICKLASSPDGSGHRNFLSGVIVSFNVTGTNAWWMQFERYHFAQIVSSMSKMHRLKKMVETEDFAFHDKVFENGIELLKSLALYVDKDDVVDEEQLVYNCPMGLELTARVTTNYLQLRTIYTQRKNHRLKEWRDFCAWIAELPYAKELITLED